MTHKPLQKTAAPAIAVLTAAGMALTACGSGTDVAEPAMTSGAEAADQADTTETSSETATETVERDVDTLAAVDKQPATAGDYSTEPTEQFEGKLAELRTIDIRVGTHDSYDRLVFEFEGQGQPEFHAGYTDEPRQQGSGYPMDVPGAAKFELLIHGTSLDMNVDAKYAGTTNLGLASGSIQDVVNGGTFEAVSQYFVGLDSKRPYKVSILQKPTRVVVDFQK